MERFGQLVCTQQDALWISLKEGGQGWLVELRVQGRAPNGWGEPRPGGSVITLPLDQLPLLLERLGQVRDAYLRRGELGQAPGAMVALDRGDQGSRGDPDWRRGLRARQYPRLAVRYVVICQPLPTDLSARPRILTAEFRDLIVGGAQIRLPCRLKQGQRVKIAGLIEGQPFRATAEVVGAELAAGREATGGTLRHHLKWLTYNSAAADILTMTLVAAPGDSPTDPDAAPESGVSPEQLPAGTAAAH